MNEFSTLWQILSTFKQDLEYFQELEAQNKTNLLVPEQLEEATKHL